MQAQIIVLHLHSFNVKYSLRNAKTCRRLILIITCILLSAFVSWCINWRSNLMYKKKVCLSVKKINVSSGSIKFSWLHTRKHNAIPHTKKNLTVAHLAKKLSMEPDNKKSIVNVNIAWMLKDAFRTKFLKLQNWHTFWVFYIVQFRLKRSFRHSRLVFFRG
jgi:hypothetical protein